MAVSLPSQTRLIDTMFTTTWYEIQAKATDNILDATPTMAALKTLGRLKTQMGGDRIFKTIRYNIHTANAVGDQGTLSMDDPDTETGAEWTWRNLEASIVRNIFEDTRNRGPAKIKSLVATKLASARDSHPQKIEARLHGAHVSAEGGEEIQSFNDMVPSVSEYTAGTYGKITRPSAFTTTNGIAAPSGGNTFWGSKYRSATAPAAMNLVSDMVKMWNGVGENMENPDLILCDKTLFETYELAAVAKEQIVKQTTTRMADLGFEVMQFKGAMMVWSPNMTASTMKFMTSKYIELIYDPAMWFSMDDWKPVENQPKRVAHILSTCNLTASALRRFGLLYYA